MAIERTMFDTQKLARALSDIRKREPVNTYWLDLCFPSSIQFDKEYVEFDRLSDVRKIAPMVVPTAQGRPIYSQAERIDRVKPAYIKMKDPITATRLFRRHAGYRELPIGHEMSAAQRLKAIAADIVNQHDKALIRREEWMAANAIIGGAVTLEGEAYPKTVVDFNRASDHTITLTGASAWGQNGVSIIDNIAAWVKLVKESPFAGVPNRLTVGTDVWEVMRKDAELKELLNVNYRQGTSDFQFDLGPTLGQEAEYVGTFNGGLQVWVYSGWYQDDDGNVVPLMDSKTAVLTGPAVDGVRCYGAIQDIDANLVPARSHLKSWSQPDPSGTFILTQSAPLMVPVNPNATLKARVLD
jgi:hypothetical protein